MNGFTLLVFAVTGALVVAIAANRLTALLRIPTPALFLVVAISLSSVFPVLARIPLKIDEHVVTIALVFILFDGGLHIGWSRLRDALGATIWVALAGTAVTAAGAALAAHLLLGIPWQGALLLGAALAATDPAVVFSVLGNREIAGRSGTILEAESGLNDPVGIALLVSLLAATGSGLAILGSTLGEFALQMAVGAAVGVVGGLGLSWLMRHSSFPNGALHALQTLAGAGFIYGAGALLHGSGFLAVFLTGILVADVGAPFKRETTRFSGGIASLAEIVTFAVLGLSITWRDLLAPDVLLTGLALGALLILVIRPILVGALLAPVRLALGERAFVLVAGLKGAVPVLLGMLVLQSQVPGRSQLYGVIVVVVLLSVLVQASAVPLLAAKLRIPMRTLAPQPYAAGLRFREDPEQLRTHTVAAGSTAEGARVGDLELPAGTSISMISRDGVPIRVTDATDLQVDDVVLAFSEDEEPIQHLFDEPDG